MSEDIERNPENNQPEEPEILINRHDGAVAVDEGDRTVLLTNNETIVVEKPTMVDIPPANRPRKVYAGMWGPVEIGVVGAASLAVIAALAVYFFFTLPARNELEQNRATRDRLEAELASARDKYGSITSTEARVAELVSSIDAFEATYLPVSASGQTALYQKLNGLISAYGLVNTSGPDYAPLEINESGDGETAESERGRSRFRSLFPGAYVTMTLEGSYANLRRFIQDIETGSDFVIISSVQLQPSENSATEQAAANPGQPQDDATSGQPMGFPTGPQYGAQVRRKPGRTLGQVVSLRLEMATYFRRAVMEAPAALAPQ